MNKLPPSGKKSRIKRSLVSSHYVSNEYLMPYMIVYHEAYSKWKAEKEKFATENPDVEYTIKPPRISEEIGAAIIQIVTGLASKGNFSHLAYKEDMIGDAIENLVLYAHNFNPATSRNVFSYFTQTAFYAFLRRIQKEKKQDTIKWEIINEMNSRGTFQEWAKSEGMDDVDPAGYLKLTPKDLERHNASKHTKIGRKKKATTPVEDHVEVTTSRFDVDGLGEVSGE